jgi:tRNA(Ile)-lysidine synthase
MPVTNLVSRVRAEAAAALVAFPSQLTLLVGVSGGPDSLCLADALAHVSGTRIVLAHLNHQLRGAEADADAQHVRAFAEARGLAVVIECQDVAALARQSQRSIELAAREARYAFLAQAAREHNTQFVAVAHHADDQAETVLFRMLRGAGTEGLRAMQQRAPLPGAPALMLLRPLLRITRKEIEHYCADLGIVTRHDASNDLRDATRNRIRHEVMPLLQEINPGVKQVLARLADSAAADAEVIAYAVEKALTHCVSQTRDSFTVLRAAWAQLPVGLQRGVLRACVRRLRPEQGVTDLNFSAIEEARDVLLSSVRQAEIALMAEIRIDVDREHFVMRRHDPPANEVAHAA